MYGQTILCNPYKHGVVFFSGISLVLKPDHLVIGVADKIHPDFQQRPNFFKPLIQHLVQINIAEQREMILPCGTPPSGLNIWPPANTPAFIHWCIYPIAVPVS